MEDKIFDIVTDLLREDISKTEAIDNLLVLFSVSFSDPSDFELQRLFDWLKDSNREPAQTNFTAGMSRNLAMEFEYLLERSR